MVHNVRLRSETQFSGSSEQVSSVLDVLFFLCSFRKVKDFSSMSGPGRSSMSLSKGTASLHKPASLTQTLTNLTSGVQNHHSGEGHVMVLIYKLFVL